jgi:hypothetical protein
VRNRSILAALVISFLSGLTPLAADPVIQRGIDVFITPADGSTYYDFAKTPIPAGFFCARSKAFTGRVALKGLPLATAVQDQIWGADTVVERLDNAAFNAKGLATTRLQFRALSLVSINPIKTACGAFHAYVSLGGEQRVTRMDIQRTQEGGGTFTAPLAADVRMTFIPVKPARNKRVRKLELTGGFTFPAIPVSWRFENGPRAKRIGPVHVDTNGDLAPDALLPGTSNFLAGQSPAGLGETKIGGECPCSERVCHMDSGKLHCSMPPPPPGCMIRRCTGIE